MNKVFHLIAVALTAGIAAGGVALAHKGASGVVKQRMELMKGIAAQMKALSPMAKGEAAFDPAQVKKSAAAIAEHAGQIPENFPEGSTGHPSEAKPAIWTEWDKFKANAEALRTSAQALEAGADDGLDATKALFAKLAETCKGCHQDFREEKR